MTTHVLHGRSVCKSTTLHGRTCFFLVALAGLASGCRDPWEKPPRRRVEPAPVASVDTSPARSSERLAPAVESDPVGPAGDLASEIAAFTDLKDCVARHKLSDPLVVDGLDAIGYDAFLTDGCRGLWAMKVRSVAPCAEVLASSVRRRCEAGVAMAAGDEALCPTMERVLGVPEPEPTCLAAARRDVRPCALLDGIERAACEGLVARDVSRCGTAERCIRNVTRWRSVLPAVLGKTPYVGKIDVEVRVADDAADGGVRVDSLSLAREAAMGASLARKDRTLLVAVGETLAVPTLGGEVHGGLYMELPDATRPHAVLAAPRVRVVLRYPDGLVQEVTNKTNVDVHVLELTEEPNAPIKLRVEATVGHKTSPRRVVWNIDTWVRSLVKEPKDAPRAPAARTSTDALPGDAPGAKLPR